MKYKTHNDGVPTQGSCGQGRITTTYARLVELFGQPSDYFDDYKSDAEWFILFEDGTDAQIYNYKNGRNYNGPSHTATEDITEWNIGGNTKRAVELVEQLI